MSHGRLAQRQVGTARSVSETGRRLLLPDEVRRLGATEQLLFVKGAAPVRAERLSYRSDVEFAGRGQPNPLYDQLAEVRS